MATPTDLTPLRTARTAFRVARLALLTALDNAGLAAAALADATRQLPGSLDLPTATSNNTTAIAAATAARANEKASRAAVQTAIANWLANVTVDQDLGRLSTAVPLVLYPVRIETRFGVDASSNPVLRVRIYPDEIFLNMHETAITRDEHAAGIAYYQGRDAAEEETPELWRQITQLMTPQRAAYVLRLLTPTAGGGTSGTSGTSASSVGLEFPTNIVFKPNDFSRPGEAILPDRWIVRTVSSAGIFDFPGNPIPEPLTITADPQAKPTSELTQIPGSNPAIMIDDEIAWTVNYDRAVNDGMAVTIPISAAQAAVGTGGFDRIIVFGVKSSFDQTETTTLLEQLFDAHHYTRGLALVPQGTPTNNTEDNPSPLPVSDPDGVASFAVERNPPPSQNTSSQVVASEALPDLPQPNAAPKNQIPDPSTDGSILARVLGVHNGVFVNVEGTGAQEQWRARQMAKLLWPTTLGYFVEQIMSPAFNATHHDRLRQYFFDNVRGRGPAPAFRIGQVPYGVLPALSIANWQARGTSVSEQLESSSQDTVARLREIWKNAALTGVPIVSASSTDPLADLLRVLSVYPSAREIRVRNASGQLTEYEKATLLGIEFQGPFNAAQSFVGNLLRQVNQPTWRNTVLAGLVFNAAANLLSIPLVAPAAAQGENQFLSTTLANLVGANNTLALINETVSLDPSLPGTAFYKLARQSVLWALVRSAIAKGPGLVPGILIEGIERQLIHVGAIPDPTPYADLLQVPVGSTLLGDTSAVRSDQQVVDVFFALAALVAPSAAPTQPIVSPPPPLVPASTAELDRLFSETLDVASHRLDAWLTAYATRRLLEMRQLEQNAALAPVGSYLGGYAIVENVRPVARNQSTLPGYGTVETQAGNGGFVQSPSLTQATAAAILRNGYMSYHDESPNKYAFDLSSARVRAARGVFEELRAGQPLGAIFGYQFERAVQSNYPIALGLNAFRFALRSYFPLVANKAGGSTVVPTATVPAVAARNVVDGLALYRAFVSNSIPFATAADLPRPNTPAWTALTTEIQRLGDAIDAVADLNVSEGVLQLIRGNVTKASGNLDALARGGRPPDPETGVSQRGGVPTSHRVAIVFPTSSAPTSPGPGWVASTPRSDAEPTLDAWAGTILGDPSKVQATVTLPPVDPTKASPSSLSVTLDKLNLRPLDLVAIARAPAIANAGSILDRRIATFAAASLAQSHDTTHFVGQIDYTPAAGQRSIPQVMEVARALGALLGGARGLASDDLVAAADAPDARASTDGPNGVLLDDIVNRATAAAAGIAQVASEFATPGADLAATLVDAAVYVPDAFPAPGASDLVISAAATAVAAELGRRIDASNKSIAASVTASADIAAQRVAQLKAIFGSDFLPLPLIATPNVSELDQALGAPLSPVSGEDVGNAPQQFLQQAGQVFDGLGRLRTLSLYRGALGQPPLRLDVAQLPSVPGGRWIGLPLKGTTPVPGSQSLLLYSLGSAAPEASEHWRGIVVQDWVEVIPNPTEETGLAFNYDNPGAEAGQAVLVVPPSTTGPTWKSSDVWATLSETLDLAKIRAVDLEQVGLAQLLPAVYLAQNVQRATISASFAGVVFAASNL